MRLVAAIAVLAYLALAACADNDKRSNGDWFGGFYGGINGAGR